MSNLNIYQKQLVDSNDKVILGIAPPGSGKTHCLAEKVKKTIKGNPNDKIVVITFTNKATMELQQRLMGYDLKNVSISTIHSWCRKELDKLKRKHGFTVEIMNEWKIKEVFATLLRQRGIAPERESFYNGLTVSNVYFAWSSRNTDSFSERALKEFPKVIRAYQSYKETNNLYDFQDYCKCLALKLDQYNDKINDIDFLFCDETQDSDPDQIECFNRIDAKQKFFIADPNQAIYGFRGADEEALERLGDATVYELEINYRSYQEILDLSYSMIDSAMNSIHNKFKDTSSLLEHCYGPEVECRVQAFKGEGAFVDLQGYSLMTTFAKEPMILVRSNRHRKQVEQTGYNKVLTIHGAKGLEFPDVIVADFNIQTTEEANIAFVGLTRAENSITVATIEDIEREARNHMAVKRLTQPTGKLF